MKLPTLLIVCALIFVAPHIKPPRALLYAALCVLAAVALKVYEVMR